MTSHKFNHEFLLVNDKRATKMKILRHLKRVIWTMMEKSDGCLSFDEEHTEGP